MIKDFFKEFNTFQKVMMVAIFGTGILYSVLDNRLLLIAGMIEFITLILSLQE